MSSKGFGMPGPSQSMQAPPETPADEPVERVTLGDDAELDLSADEAEIGRAHV